MRQLTRHQAETIVQRAIDKALAFGPQSGPVPKGTTVEDIRRIADFAAFNALRDAGVLAAMQRDEARQNAIAADRATREHRAWCRKTGSPC